ncbi:MAG: TonB-dependent siderophore receptor [Pseudomonadota bacterium]|nr:TonB-dependent siderophore receptor [Pseudomonadota bacterium]
MLNVKTPLALAISAAMAAPLSYAQDMDTTEAKDSAVTLDTVAIKAVRDDRISKGAIGLPLELKETPQSITVLNKDAMANFDATSTNDALKMMNGIDIQDYETNRATFNARGFEVQLTQVDGIGTSNDYATVIGEQDTFLFEKIELVRGANGLLTGVGNSSGTVNYVRKRPTNEDQGEILFSLGEFNKVRLGVDGNKVLTDDGRWAGRVVAVQENKESHIRDLETRRTSFYWVVDGQVGEDGILTFGSTFQSSAQDSPMWGSLTLNYANGGYADFDVSSSTSADWSYWNTKTRNAFVEYLHDLGNGWEAKVSLHANDFSGQSRLLYAYTLGGGLNDDNTGLVGWPYAGYTEKSSVVVDWNISGDFEAFGNYHSVLVGASHIEEENTTYNRPVQSGGFLPYPAFDEYDGDDYAEPVFGAKEKRGDGEKSLTRFYASSRFGLTDDVNLILGANAVRLEREGSSIYGSTSETTNYPVLEEVSPYAGATWNVTEDFTTYVSYSDIFQNQDEQDLDGEYLEPMKGVNYEVGAKAEFLDDRVLATFAVFKAEQQGVAINAGTREDATTYYAPENVNSKGFEAELAGELNKGSNVAVGVTRLRVTDENGDNTSTWIPRTTWKARYDSVLSFAPKVRLGANATWKSDASNPTGNKQDAFMVVDTFAAYEFNEQAKLKLNIDNILDEKYVNGVQFGAIYGAPRNANLTFNFKF